MRRGPRKIAANLRWDTYHVVTAEFDRARTALEKELSEAEPLEPFAEEEWVPPAEDVEAPLCRAVAAGALSVAEARHAAPSPDRRNHRRSSVEVSTHPSRISAANVRARRRPTLRSLRESRTSHQPPTALARPCPARPISAVRTSHSGRVIERQVEGTNDMSNADSVELRDRLERRCRCRTVLDAALSLALRPSSNCGVLSFVELGGPRMHSVGELRAAGPEVWSCGA